MGLKDARTPRSSAYTAVVFGTPTFGMVPWDFHTNDRAMATPIFITPILHGVKNKPVDVARNEICWEALQNERAYVLFRDDDVLAPRDTLAKLLGRLGPKAKAFPEQCYDILGGVVYSKQTPPSPMIYLEGNQGGYEDWEFNELLQVDAIGMGCSLIPIGALIATLPNVRTWRCSQPPYKCRASWSIEHEEGGKCPECDQDLKPDWFKTIRDYADREPYGPMSCTEDAYFCELVRESGGRVFVDTGVQCKHYCVEQKMYFGWLEDYGPVWQSELDGTIYRWPGVDEPGPAIKKLSKEKWKIGGVRVDGWVPVLGNLVDISGGVAEAGHPKEIWADKALMSFPEDHIAPAINSWCRNLQPGGKITITIDDMSELSPKQIVKRGYGSYHDKATVHLMLDGFCNKGWECDISEKDGTYSLCAVKPDSEVLPHNTRENWRRV
jgi:hypothetical protein